MEIRLQHAFGSAAGLEIRDSVLFSEEGLLIYPAGRMLVVKEVASGDITFVPTDEKVIGITAITSNTQQSQRLLAVAEQTSNEVSAQITIREIVKSGSNFKPIKRLFYADLESKVYLSLALAPHLQVIVGVSGSPDYQAVVWDLRKEAVIAVCKLPSIATRVLVRPRSPLTVSTSGPNHMHVWLVKEKTMYAQVMAAEISQGRNYTDHTWTDGETLVLVTDTGEGFVQKEGSLVQQMANLFGLLESDEAAGATCVAAFSKGFLVGSDRGTITLWDKADFDVNQSSSDVFSFIRTWNTGKPYPLASLAFSPSEDIVGISLKNNDIGTCSLTQVYQLSLDVPVSIFCYGYHYGPITGLDVAAHRPLIATCSQVDSSVRIWNYLTHKCELAKKLYVVESGSRDTTGEASSQQLLSLAFHPNGYLLALGFTDKVRVFHVLYDELRLFKDILVKSATRMKFSNGGHLLALVSQKTVHIYSAVTFEPLQALKGHSSQVLDIAWNLPDSRFVSVGLEGKLTEYETLGFSKAREVQRRSGSFAAVSYVANNLIVACGNDAGENFLQEVQASDNLRELDIQEEVKQLFYLQSRAGNALIAGSRSGKLQAFKDFASPIYHLSPHRGEITKLTASLDGKYLFSAGEDGVIFEYVIGVSRKTLSGERNARASLVDEQLADVILLRRSQLDEFRSSQEQAKIEMEAIRQKQDFVNQQLESKLHSELQLKEAKLTQELRASETRIEELKKQKSTQEHEYVVNRINVESAHVRRVGEVERLYEAKLYLEDEQIRQLELDKIELKKFYELQLRENQRKHEEIVTNLAAEFTIGLKKAHEEYENSHKSVDSIKARYEERLNQMDDEHEAEIVELTAKFEKLLMEKTAKVAKVDADAKAETEEEKEKEKQRVKNIEILIQKESEIVKLREDLSKNSQQLKTLEAVRKDLAETLEKKEHKLYQYKFQLKDMKKVKLILQEEKKDAVKQLQPKEKEIQELKMQLEAVNDELETLQRAKDHQRNTINEQNLLLSQLKNEVKTLKSYLALRERKLKDLLNDIYHKVSGSESSKTSKDLLDLFHTYVEEEAATLIKEDPESIAELKKHLTHMELSLAGLRESKSKLGSRMKGEARKRILENSQLIQELNKLRGDKRELEQKTKTLEQQVRGFSKQLGRMEDEAQRLSTTGLQDLSRASVQQTSQTFLRQRATSAHPLKKALGHIHKGSAFDNKMLNVMDRQRVVELEKELETRKEHLFALSVEITQLKDQLNKPNMSEQASFSLLPRERNLSP